MDQRSNNDPTPRKSIGYHGQELSEEQVAAITCIRDTAKTVQALVDALAEIPGIDPRWLQIGRTELQKGFMFVTRAIANPPTF